MNVSEALKAEDPGVSYRSSRRPLGESATLIDLL
jgi:hypothetical protein